MMEDNNKLFVFDKKEVVLIFVFVIVVAVTAFTIGVRIGKQLSLKEDGYTKEDVQNINLKSVDEEYVESVTEDPPKNFEGALNKEEDAPAPTANQEDVEARLREEMKKLAEGNPEAPSGAKVEEAPVAAPEAGPVDEASPVEPIRNEEQLYTSGNDVRGKYTIQLYANQSKAAAQDFADAFIVKGYDVIINEAEIPGKGTWYRVSVGAFDSIEEAKTYLQKEKSLFQGEDYLIQKL